MKNSKNQKQKLTAEPRCSNCFACRKDTIFCSISPNYDPEKAFKMLQAQLKGGQHGH